MKRALSKPLATIRDLSFMHKDVKWLDRSVVLYRVSEREGRYWVEMVFVDSSDPMRFITRRIDHYPTRAKAELFAQVFQRQIRRDPRGTFTLDDDAFNLLDN